MLLDIQKLWQCVLIVFAFLINGCATPPPKNNYYQFDSLPDTTLWDVVWMKGPPDLEAYSDYKPFTMTLAKSVTHKIVYASRLPHCEGAGGMFRRVIKPVKNADGTIKFIEQPEMLEYVVLQGACFIACTAPDGTKRNTFYPDDVVTAQLLSFLQPDLHHWKLEDDRLYLTDNNDEPLAIFSRRQEVLAGGKYLNPLPCPTIGKVW